mmetsp:Transcript_76916/g.124439  ORF Transcript_76916/g.124439 Transcript_76916/m.124439 type:complete len:224 (-) Transcript_76916:1281-1952(-)
MFLAILDGTNILVAVGEQHYRVTLPAAYCVGKLADWHRRLSRRHEDLVLLLAASRIDLCGWHNHFDKFFLKPSTIPHAHNSRAALVGQNATAMFLVFPELAHVDLAVWVALLTHLVAHVVVVDPSESSSRGPRVGAKAVEHRVLELAGILVIGDEADCATALHVARVEFARVDGATACGQRALAAHLSKLPLATIYVCLVWPLECAFPVIEAIEEFTHVARLH